MSFPRLYVPSMGAEALQAVTVPTEAEKQLLAKVAVLKMVAATGHKGARKKLQDVAVKVLKVQSKAKAGDPKAVHLVEVLRDSRIFASSPASKKG
jgi:hypothetical protein